MDAIKLVLPEDVGPIMATTRASPLRNTSEACATGRHSPLESETTSTELSVSGVASLPGALVGSIAGVLREMCGHLSKPKPSTHLPVSETRHALFWHSTPPASVGTIHSLEK